jgi:hypothetical protein
MRYNAMAGKERLPLNQTEKRRKLAFSGRIVFEN